MKTITLDKASDDLWETILRALETGGCSTSKSKLYLQVHSVGYGRTKIAISKSNRFLGIISFNGELGRGTDLSKARIKLVRDRSDERRVLEKAIKDCKYFVTKANQIDGNYDISITERLLPSIMFTRKRSGCEMLPFPYLIIGMMGDGREERRHSHHEEQEEDCDEFY